MVTDSVSDRGGGPQHELPSVDSFGFNGVSALTCAESLPIRGVSAPAASESRLSEVNGGDDRVNVRKRRGRPPKVGGGGGSVTGAPPAKRIKEDDDVCFICFDGGSLVLCDHRDCPKAYHPACVKRDESFFTPKLRWNCGWHLCNVCQRNALFMCYTCPYSLCKSCVKQADISCVRGNKGFCKTCMNTISLIENIKQGSGNDQVQAPVDFDDATSWEYLFKVYWVLLKQKESLTLDELTRASNPWKVQMLNHVNNNVELSMTTSSLETNNNQVETSVCKRRKTRRQMQMQNNSCEKIVTYKLPKSDVDWASKELLEFVAYVKNGDTSKLTQFDVQALLLEYIRKNKLRDPRRKCQIICDKRLEFLFGKSRLGHFEMLKLLEYHFKDGLSSSSVVRAGVIDSSVSEMKLEECSEDSHIVARESKRQTRKKVDERQRHIKLDNYAAINIHNMSLIYLRRNFMENLLEDVAKFHDKVVGSIVRIRIADNDLKQEMYRLVQVVGTGKAAEPYKIGDKTAHVVLKILNLDKIEDVRIDAISNQDLSEDECIRLCQNIKCGLVERMTVAEILKKAIALQEVRIKDALETEICKLNQLRDRASEMGHRKELRECIEKLDLLKSPEERLRRMHEIPEVQADPRMDPMYQSDEGSEQSATKEDVSMTPIHSISNSSADVIARSSSSNWDSKRNVSDRPQINKEDDAARSLESSQSTLDLEKDAARILEELRNQVEPCRIAAKHEVTKVVNHPRDASDASVTSSSRSVLSRNTNTEFEKIWHYRDPSGKIQGPFCMLQLRKWNSDGYFPADLRIWRIDESQDKSLLLNDVLSNQCNEDQFQSDCVEPHGPRFVSECRSPENGRQLSININAAWPSDKPHEVCNSDLAEKVKCYDDQRQLSTELPTRRQEADLESSSQISPEENHKSSLDQNRKSSPVPSSPVREVSNTCVASRDTVLQTSDQNHKSPLVASSPGREVSNTCLASGDTTFQTVDHNHKSSVVPSSPHREVPNTCVSGDTVFQTADQNHTSSIVASSPAREVSNTYFASGDIVFQTADQNHKPDCSELASLKPNSSDEGPKCFDDEPGQKVSSLGTSSDGIAFPKSSSSTVKIESYYENFKGQEENKTEEHNQPVSSVFLQQNSGGLEKTTSGHTSFTDLLTQTAEELSNDETKFHANGFKEPVASFLHGQDSFTSWQQALSSAVGLSVPVSPANPNSEGLATELSLSSNAVFSWNSAAPLAGETSQWAGYSSDMKFSDHATTTTNGASQLNHSLATHLDCNALFDGLIELSTLGDESVSDLLSEVEAMESLHGMPSPNIRIDFGDDDPIGSPNNECFSPLVGMSLPLMTGKHDSWLTDPQPTYSPPRDDTRLKQDSFVPSSSSSSSAQQDFLSLTCTPHPTSLSLGPKMEKPHEIFNNSLNFGFATHMEVAPIPSQSETQQRPVVHADVAVPAARSPVEEGEVEVTASLSLELSVNVHSPKDQFKRNAGFPPTNGISPRDGKASRSTGGQQQPRNRGSQQLPPPRHLSGRPGARVHSNIDPGPGFLKPARPTSWSRQSSFNGGSRQAQPGHRGGQRVCKFYESGYCKKGSSCNYLHP